MLALHGVVTAVSLVRHGWRSPFPPFDDWRQAQLFSDLVCACVLFVLALGNELRRQGRPRWQVLALGLAIAGTGSIAPIVLLLLDGRLLGALIDSGRESASAGGE